MKVEITEKSGVKHDGREFSFEDIVTVPDAVGEYFCAAGWAKDVAGEVPTGERNTSNVMLCPEGAKHIHTGENVDG